MALDEKIETNTRGVLISWATVASIFYFFGKRVGGFKTKRRIKKYSK